MEEVYPPNFMVEPPKHHISELQLGKFLYAVNIPLLKNELRN